MPLIPLVISLHLYGLIFYFKYCPTSEKDSRRTPNEVLISYAVQDSKTTLQ